MDLDTILLLSLLILLLPLAGFVFQLVVGRMKTPSDYVVDPHENPPVSYDVDNPADEQTAIHAQSALDEPLEDSVHGNFDAPGLHLEVAVARGRGEWTDRDQRRAYRLTWVSTGIVAVGLVLALILAAKVLSMPMAEATTSVHPKAEWTAIWYNFADAATNIAGYSYHVTLGVLADNLSAIMLVVVMLVSLLVHLFSSEYMRAPAMHGGRLNRYFGFLGLFTFSMIGIVLSNSLLMIYIFWELVGLSSYLLIGFWYERPAPQYASRKAFIVNRIGDIGMFLGIIIIFTQLGTFQLSEIFDHIAGGALPFGSEAWLTAAGVLLFCGAIGKSAQFPLNVWLPDAMEGPTPVSALIHAATMVAAGVYLTARIFPMLTGDALLFIAAIGAFTSVLAASIAMVQWDLKKVLAFSTVSQLGYMVLAMGVGAWSAGVFHLVTHAMFKALLFLGSGSVIHMMHHSLHELHDHGRDPQDMRNMGALRRKMPITYWTMLIATFAISGIPLFSGYMSKDEILAGAWAFAELSPSLVAMFVVVIGYVVAAMTAFYMFRMIFLTFWGEPKAEDIHTHMREAPRLMTVPLAILAAFSLWIGFGANPLDPAGGWFMSKWIETPASVVPATAEPMVKATDGVSWQKVLESTLHHLHATGIPHVISAPAMVSLLLAALGILVAFILYGRSGATGQNVSYEPPRGLRAFLFNRWYQDNLYEEVFPVAFTAVLSRTAAWFDQNIVDGIVNGVAAAWVGFARFIGDFDTYVVDGIVNGVAGTMQFFGLFFRQLQTGRIQTYLVYVALGIAALFLLFR